MTTYQFMVRLAFPPSELQVARLLDTLPGVCVEVGAFRRWAAVAADRPAVPGESLVAAVVAVVRALDAVGLAAIDTGPDCDVVPVSLIAARVGRPVRTVRRWTRHRSGFPDPVQLPGRPRYYPWLPTAAWLAEHRPWLAPAGTGDTHLAVNRALALRELADRVPDLGAVAALFDGAPR